MFRKIINKAINKFKNYYYDIVTNVFPRSFPVGQSVEVINSEVFKKYYKHVNKNEKEHILKFFYKNFKHFKILNLKNKKNMSKINLSINNMKDFLKIKKIIEKNEKI